MGILKLMLVEQLPLTIEAAYLLFYLQLIILAILFSSSFSLIALKTSLNSILFTSLVAFSALFNLLPILFKNSPSFSLLDVR